MEFKEDALVIKTLRVEFEDVGEETMGYMKFTINTEYIIRNIIPFSIHSLISDMYGNNIEKVLEFIDIIIYTCLFKRYCFETIEFENNKEHRTIIIKELARFI